MGDFRSIVLDNDETNKALGGAGRKVRVAVAGYGGLVGRETMTVRPTAPGYGRFGKALAKGRVTVPGYGTAPISVRIVGFPNS